MRFAFAIGIASLAVAGVGRAQDQAPGDPPRAPAVRVVTPVADFEGARPLFAPSGTRVAFTRFFRNPALRTTEDPPFAPDPAPIRHSPTEAHFHRPGAILFRSVIGNSKL